MLARENGKDGMAEVLKGRLANKHSGLREREGERNLRRYDSFVGYRTDVRAMKEVCIFETNK
jgi:hypothetical protein